MEESFSSVWGFHHASSVSTTTTSWHFGNSVWSVLYVCFFTNSLPIHYALPDRPEEFSYAFSGIPAAVKQSALRRSPLLRQKCVVTAHCINRHLIMPISPRLTHFWDINKGILLLDPHLIKNANEGTALIYQHSINQYDFSHYGILQQATYVSGVVFSCRFGETPG